MQETEPNETLSQRLESTRGKLQSDAAATIAALQQIAQNLEMQQVANRLRDLHDELLADNFKIIVVGRFSTGKSTFLNALISEGSGATAEPLPMSQHPTTATITRIVYAEKPFVTMWTFDGRHEDWSIQEFVRRSMVRADPEENDAFFKLIREFEVGYPTSIGRSGVTLIDSPGDDEDLARTAITRAGVQRSDAAILMFRSDILAGLGDRTFAKDVVESGAKIFTVVNMFGEDEPDEQLKDFAWNRICVAIFGEGKNVPRDFEKRDVFFVNAKKALIGRRDGQAPLIEQSGLGRLERRLSDFLLRERYEAHINAFMIRALSYAGQMKDSITDRRQTLSQDREELERSVQRYQEKIEELVARQKQIPEIIEPYRKNVSFILRDSYVALIDRLSKPAADKKIPKWLETYEVRATKGLVDRLVASVHAKNAMQEIAEYCNSYIQARIVAWGQDPNEPGGATSAVADTVTAMIAQITTTVGRMQSDLNDVRVSIGWSSQSDESDAVDWGKRVLWAIPGLLLHDPLLIASGGATGFRGIAGGVAGSFVVGLGLGALSLVGITLSGPLLPVALVAGWIFGGEGLALLGLDGRLKQRAWDGVFKRLQEIRSGPSASLEIGIQQSFNELQGAIMAAVEGLLSEERQEAQAIVAQNRAGEATKARRERELAELFEQISRQQEVVRSIQGAVKELASS